MVFGQKMTKNHQKTPKKGLKRAEMTKNRLKEKSRIGGVKSNEITKNYEWKLFIR